MKPSMFHRISSTMSHPLGTDLTLGVLAMLLAGCTGDAPPPPTGNAGNTSPETVTETDPPTGITLPALCEAGETTSADPISLHGQVAINQSEEEPWLMELVEVEVDPERQLAYGGGGGGVVVFDVSDPAAPELVGYHPDPPEEFPEGRFYELAVSGERVYGTNRDVELIVVDTSDPTTPTEVFSLPEVGLSGLWVSEPYLYAVSHYGELIVYSLEDPDKPVEIDRQGGLENAWDLVLSGDVGWIADNTLGIVPVDLSDPAVPVLGEPVPLDGGPQHLALGDGVLYAATGSGGIASLDLEDPLAPELLGSITYGASVQSVAVDGDILWAVNQEDILALDISDPHSPQPVASKQTEQWAMHVAAFGGKAFVADWARMSVFNLDATVPAPDIDISASELFVGTDPEQILIQVANRGTQVLSLLGATIDDERFTITASDDQVAPGDQVTLTLDWAGGEEAAATLCLSTDDADEPLATVEIHTGLGGNHEAIGEQAPDFVLEGIDGNSYRLSEHLGQPIVLVFFLPG
jgi:hypothetical protein